jgi:uncharacterized protein with ParB-like and HNH nuclease domain
MDDPIADEDIIEKILEQEVEESSTDDTNELPPNDIVAFNELRSCFELARLAKNGKLDIKPDFQREVVWNSASQTRFIDSLAKQLPIPSMCIALDFKLDKRYMVDGLQRMSSIIKFLSDNDWRLAKLKDIDPNLSGKKVSFIKENSKEIYERIESLTIPVTVLRCDMSKKAHQEYLFTIFHRLNAGGSRLNNQEIRNCIFQGTLNNLLLEISGSQAFKDIFDIRETRKYRFSNEELLLRALAHSDQFESYSGPLSKYLNEFMGVHRNADVADFREKLDFVINFTNEKILTGAAFSRVSKALVEALFVAIIRNKHTLRDTTIRSAKQRFTNLKNDPLFSVDALSEGLAAPDKVKARLKRAIEIFA